MEVKIELTDDKKAGFPLLIDWEISDGTGTNAATYGADSSSGDYGLPTGASYSSSESVVKGTSTISVGNGSTTVRIPIYDDDDSSDETFSFTITDVWDTTSQNSVRKGYINSEPRSERRGKGTVIDEPIVVLDDDNKTVTITISPD